MEANTEKLADSFCVVSVIVRGFFKIFMLNVLYNADYMNHWKMNMPPSTILLKKMNKHLLGDWHSKAVQIGWPSNGSHVSCHSRAIITPIHAQNQSSIMPHLIIYGWCQWFHHKLMLNLHLLVGKHQGFAAYTACRTPGCHDRCFSLVHWLSNMWWFL